MKFLSGILKSRTSAKSDAGKSVTPAVERGNPWHAVSIVSKMSRCEAARALRPARMLSGTAPRLPLPGCDFGKACLCSYKHHSDRRGLPRRKSELTGLRPNVKIARERRVSLTRRLADDVVTFDESTLDV